MNNVLYAAVDVDDKSFHISIRSKTAPNELIAFITKPNTKALLAKLIACRDKFNLGQNVFDKYVPI